MTRSPKNPLPQEDLSSAAAEVSRASLSDVPPSGTRPITQLTPFPKSAVGIASTTPLKTVLIIETEPTRQAHLKNTVGSEYRALAARDVDEALSLLDEEPIFFVLAGAEYCDVRLLTALAARQLASATAFLADSTQVERLITEYSSQHVFSVLHDQISPSDLVTFLHSILAPRMAPRHEARDVEVWLNWGPKRRVKYALLDISNRGLAMLVAADQGLLLPDTHIPSLRLVRRKRLLLSGMSAIVRHVELLGNYAGQSNTALVYKLGLEFLGATPPVKGEFDKIVVEPIRILSLIRNGLSDAHLNVRHADFPRHAQPAPLLGLDLERETLRVGGQPPAGLTVGDVVRANFEYMGTNYSFLSSIVELRAENSSYAIKAPRAIRAIRQRRSARIQPPTNESICADIKSPYDGSTVTRPVLDITTSGVAFAISERTELFPVGTHLEKLRLRFPTQPTIVVSGVVRSLRTAHEFGAEHQAICGVEFKELDATTRAKLADTIVQCGQPHLKDGAGTPFAVLWAFLIRARFLYPEKLRRINVPEVEVTLTQLLDKTNDALKTSLLEKDGEIIGHASAVLAYRQTWFLQHLATISTGKTMFTSGRLLNLAVIRYLEQIPGIEFVKIWFRPNNRWPVRVFGTFAKRVGDPRLSHLETFTYLVSSTDQTLSSRSDVFVRTATNEDLRHVEAYFVSHVPPILVRADDLSSNYLTLAPVSAIYRQLKLDRVREILVAESGGRMRGFALLEISAAGLNLSELTNAFRVFTFDQADASAKQALIQSARNRYGELGRTSCIALAPPDESSYFESLGFESCKRYTCWTWHRSLYQRFCDHILKLHLGE